MYAAIIGHCHFFNLQLLFFVNFSVEVILFFMY